MKIQRRLSPVLIAALLSVIVPVNTWAAGADAAKNGLGKTDSSKFQAAITRAAADAAVKPSLQLRPMQPKSEARMQGSGGHTGMIIGLVTTVVGAAATVYMVKTLQKTTKAATQQQNP